MNESCERESGIICPVCGAWIKCPDCADYICPRCGAELSVK